MTEAARGTTGGLEATRILFAFENALPSAEADAEVFTNTARCLAPLTSQSVLHVPLTDEAYAHCTRMLPGVRLLRAWAPRQPAVLRHVCCGLTIVLRQAFRSADVVYTRNLWVAWVAVSFGQRVVFDHYRPWPDQIPPLQFWIYRLMRHDRFLINICHSEYTRRKYLDLGLPADKLACVHNGFDPARFRVPLALDAAKRSVGIECGRKTVVYTGRLNHKKGLELVIEAARRLPDVVFVLVGSYGGGPIETLASVVSNVVVVAWQSAETLGLYMAAADVLLIPPSLSPLATFGSTVLPLKIFLYMASGRTILAGDTPDVREVLRHRRNAFLCPPDSVADLVAGIEELMRDGALAARLAAAALAESRDLTWDRRAQRIADIVARRLQARRGAQADWTDVQFRAWMAKSWRWLVNLVRTRSFVLPPEIEFSPASLRAADIA